MEIPGVGVIPLEPPPEEQREFMKRKMTHWIRTFEYNVDGKLNRQHIKKEVEKYIETHSHHYKTEAEKKKAIEERMDIWEFALMGDQHDKDEITEEELVNIWVERTYSPPEKRKEYLERDKKICAAFFHQVDLNKNGVIEYSEFYAATQILKDETIKVLFDAVDHDKNGVSSLNEWLYAIINFHMHSGPDSIFSLMFGPIPNKI